MKRTLTLACFALFAFVGCVSAQTIPALGSIQFTPAQLTGLDHAVTNANAAIAAQNLERAKQTPPQAPLPSVTAASYLTARIKEVLNSYASEVDAAELKAVTEKLAALPDEKRKAARDAADAAIDKVKAEQADTKVTSPRGLRR